MPKKTTFWLLDGRAKDPGQYDRASVLATARTEKEARDLGSSTFKDYDAIWFEYEVRKVHPKRDAAPKNGARSAAVGVGADGRMQVIAVESVCNPKKRGDIPPIDREERRRRRAQAHNEKKRREAMP